MQPMKRLNMRSCEVQSFLFGTKGGGGSVGRDFFPFVPNAFSSCSHEVPSSSQVVPSDIPKNTSVLSLTVLPKVQLSCI